MRKLSYISVKALLLGYPYAYLHVYSSIRVTLNGVTLEDVGTLSLG